MFEFIRNHQRWMQLILLILIVPSFAFFGVQSYSSFMSEEPKMATVAGHPITQREYDQARRNQLDQYRQMMGARFDAAALDNPAMRQRLLDQLIDQRVLAAAAADNRFSVSDETLRNTIASNPAVQDDGRFSAERYRAALAAQGLSPAAFEANLRGQLAIDRVLQPVGQTARVPGEVAGSVEHALTETRGVRTRRFAAADFRSQVQVSDADLQTWYDANKQQFLIPEQVKAQYLVLDEAAASKDINVKDEDVQRYYDQNKSRFGQPERRRASHIMIELPANATDAQRKEAQAKADDLAKQAAADPANFAELAKKNSQDAGSANKGGDLGWLVPGVIAPTLEKAIDGLKKDQVSGVVQSPYGLHIIKLTDLQPAQFKPLADVKAQIVDEIRKQIAASRFSDMATKLTSLVYDQRDSLQPAADALGLKLREAGGIGRTELLAPEQAGAGSAAGSPDSALLDSPKVRQVLFSPEVLRDKQNSGVIELSPDTMLAVRVASMTPAHVPPLDQLKDKIRAKLVDERAADAAAKAGEQALEALRKDPAAPLDGFAAAVDISRDNPQNLSRPVLDAVMRVPAKPLPAFVGAREASDYVIARIEKIEAGKNDPAVTTALSQQLSSAWGQAEDAAVLKVLREQYKVQIAPEAAKVLKGDDIQTDAS
ncbi:MULTISPECIES: SurA N-terminal domain-containing protein [unclassified Achromobacter]|uniref:SurA N-terminal domain-containing protein n=1 Tax=unclassified Achromobacter TaxID=2626865 RepID=UPI000B51825B|nr:MULTISPECIES: SurA N-terminal domain-containing protein [unclassified Achromobacter]OWT80605.1 peptidylprolyl isomerase [Achromobacter sp. HZ34]OWT82488.1 peptidylprolyl isomerase [Achromobacter sp. HZ28]